MTRILAAISFLTVLLISCQSEKETKNPLKTGIWRATIEIQGQQLPFNFELTNDEKGGYDIFIRNADEKLQLD